MKRFLVCITLAVLSTIPGLSLRLAHRHTTPLVDTVIFFAAILGASFLLSWGAEAAEEHVSQGLAIGILALVTVLPEYAVDIYYTLRAGQHPGSDYVQFAAANMTGANRLLIGLAWPLVVLLFWWKSGRRSVSLRWENAAEVAFLALASLYSFVITWKGRIDFWDTLFLFAIFVGYLWRLSRLPKDEDGDDDDDEVGPAAALATLPKAKQYAIMAVLTVFAGLVILAAAEPFAESLIAAGQTFGINKFLLIQWVAPLAGEAPEIILTVLFCLALKPTAALGALVSDKINQWTLLVGMIPLFYSLGAGHVGALPLDARQHEEFFLTAAQSLFAVALLLRLRFSLASGLALLGLFCVQLGLAFVCRHDEARTIRTLTDIAWLYLALAAGTVVWNRQGLWDYLRVGLLAGNAPREVGGVGGGEDA